MREQSFAFSSDGVVLRGTLTLPEGGASAPPAAIALLLSGSGPQDRDESAGEVRPFKVLAAQLAALGYAVLRWDDRGVGESEGDYLSVSAHQLCRDALAAAVALPRAWAAPHEVFTAPSPPLILVGHSQGALIGACIAAALAEASPRDGLVETANLLVNPIAGLVLLAGMALSGRETLLIQHEALAVAEGWTAEDVTETLAQKRRLFDVLQAADSSSDEARLGAHLSEILTEAAGDLAEAPAWLEERDAVVADLLEWEWRYLLGADPTEHLAHVGCPVLALFGERDLHVSAARHAPAFARVCQDSGLRGLATVVPGANHLFQQTDDGRSAAWFTGGDPFAPPFSALLEAGMKALELLPSAISPETGPS
ncbi:MAG: alpha/beta fold hydrolase [Pseudomonadota bacterium]